MDLHGKKSMRPALARNRSVLGRPVPMRLTEISASSLTPGGPSMLGEWARAKYGNVARGAFTAEIILEPDLGNASVRKRCVQSATLRRVCARRPLYRFSHLAIVAEWLFPM